MADISAKANIWEFLPEAFVASIENGLPTVLNEGWFRHPRRPSSWYWEYQERVDWRGQRPIHRAIIITPLYKRGCFDRRDAPVEIAIPYEVWRAAAEKQIEFLRTHVLREENYPWEETEPYGLPSYRYWWEEI